MHRNSEGMEPDQRNEEAANTHMSLLIKTTASRHGKGSKAVKKERKKQRNNKQSSAGCLICVCEEDTVDMLAYQGAVGGWE